MVGNCSAEGHLTSLAGFGANWSKRNPHARSCHACCLIAREVPSSSRDCKLSMELRGNGRANGRARPVRKLNLSPKRRAQLKLQGQYIGYLRNLKPRQKPEVKRLRERMGIQAD